MACRRRADALESATHGRVAAETSRDIFSQWWVAAAVIEAEFASDRAAIPDMTRRREPPSTEGGIGSASIDRTARECSVGTARDWTWPQAQET